MRWSASDIAAAERTLARSAAGEVTHVVTLTDEEVTILDGLQNPQIVALPWLDAQEGAAEVTGPLVLRRTATAIVSAERTTAIGRHWVYLYLHEDDRVLEEEVAPSGHHSFSVYPLSEVSG